MTELRIAHLEITDMLYSLGATHSYGRIIFPFKSDGTSDKMHEDVELGFTMSRIDAESANKKEKMFRGGSTYLHVYKKGEWSTRFDHKIQIPPIAIKHYNEHLSKEWDLLVQGRTGIIEPQEIIAHSLTDKKQILLINKINRIHKSWSKFEVKWDREGCAAEKGMERWQKIWEPVWCELTGEHWI